MSNSEDKQKIISFSSFELQKFRKLENKLKEQEAELAETREKLEESWEVKLQLYNKKYKIQFSFYFRLKNACTVKPTKKILSLK